MNRTLLHRIEAGGAAFVLALGAQHFCGCETANVLSQGVAAVGVASGTITAQQGQSLVRSTEAVGKAFETLTPENEYYVGRAVMATVLQKYQPHDRPDLNLYLNTLGRALAANSEMPETFGGYHFLALDSEDINAFAAPGGLIVVTRGLLRCCRNEDALAAVLAHEIGHVQCRHGIKAINTSRWTGAVTTVATEAGKSLGGKDLAEATRALEGSVSDIAQTMMNSGYGRAAERQADLAAVAILRNTGYNPAALIDMLQVMKAKLKPGGHDFTKTHPDPQERIASVMPAVGAMPAVQEPPARQQRFQQYFREF